MQGARGIGTVVGVDLSNHKACRFEDEEVPGTGSLLRDRLRRTPSDVTAFRRCSHTS